MKKQGFTLVELLAVIALLAMLAIIAIPNIMDLLNSAKSNSFFNEVQSVYDIATRKYMLSQIEKNGEPMTFSSLDGYDKLEIQGGTGEFQYCIMLDGNGFITYANVTNGNYDYVTTDNSKKANKQYVEKVDDEYSFSCVVGD